MLSEALPDCRGEIGAIKEDLRKLKEELVSQKKVNNQKLSELDSKIGGILAAILRNLVPIFSGSTGSTPLGIPGLTSRRGVGAAKGGGGWDGMQEWYQEPPGGVQGMPLGTLSCPPAPGPPPQRGVRICRGRHSSTRMCFLFLHRGPQ